MAKRGQDLNRGDGRDAVPLVLHVPYTFFPEASGGTEVYVLGLAKRLDLEGFGSAVAAPASVASEYLWEGVCVHRFAVDPRQGMAHAYGAPDQVAAAGMKAIIERLRPVIVHLHSRTAAVSELLVDAAHDAGALVVLTYHTPTMSCARGTMLLMGAGPCDGKLDRRRCVSCALAGIGLPSMLSRALAQTPSGVADAVADWELSSPWSVARVPGLIARAHSRFRRLIAKVDHVVAVCDWVADVLRRNGVADDRLLVSRQGLTGSLPNPALQRIRQTANPVRIAYFGRLDRTKGVDVLAAALQLAPRADVTIDLFLVLQPGSESEFEVLEAIARKDVRLSLHQAVPPEQVVEAMSRFDLIAVPSRWMETGPLVVLEAFAAGVPVLGADRGGIAELVRDGVNGILFPPDNASALARLLERVSLQPELIDAWRSNVNRPRTDVSVVGDMAQLYRRLLISRPTRRLPADGATSCGS